MTEITTTEFGEVLGRDAVATLETTLPSGRSISVEVFGPRERFGTTAPATVNWPGIGSVDAEDAAAFAALLVAASEKAAVWSSIMDEFLRNVED